MPVADTEFLFALNPKDGKHIHALKILEKVRRKEIDVVIPDVALLEYYLVLKSRGVSLVEIRKLLDSLNDIFSEYGLKEIRTINKGLIKEQVSLEVKYGAGFFDSLLAASARVYDGSIISDDKVYEKLGLRRIRMSRGAKDE